MNEDYLWDRSGDDPEIEKLEKTLAVFRHTETEAPVVQMPKTMTVVETAPGWRFSFGYAFAALAVAVILVGVWVRTSSGPDTSEKNMASVTKSQATGEISNQSNVIADQATPGDKVQNCRSEIKSASDHAKRHAALIYRQSKTITVRSQYRTGTAALTKEEKYAYRQLMLALSITGSKLKIVQDTINGVEEGENTTKENER